MTTIVELVDISPICECGTELDPINQVIATPLQEWLCAKCHTLYAVINGVFGKVPERGKLIDWPELQAYFDTLVKESFGELIP